MNECLRDGINEEAEKKTFLYDRHNNLLFCRNAKVLTYQQAVYVVKSDFEWFDLYRKSTLTYFGIGLLEYSI